MANGVDMGQLTEEDVLGMMVMWHAGLIGNSGLMRTLGTLTCVQVNKSIAKHVKSYELKDIMPDYVNISTRQLSSEEMKAKTNEELVKLSHAHQFDIIKVIQEAEARHGKH